MTSRGRTWADGRKRKKYGGESAAPKCQKTHPGPTPTEDHDQRIQLSICDLTETSNQGAAAGQEIPRISPRGPQRAKGDS